MLSLAGVADHAALFLPFRVNNRSRPGNLRDREVVYAQSLMVSGLIDGASSLRQALPLYERGSEVRGDTARPGGISARIHSSSVLTGRSGARKLWASKAYAQAQTFPLAPDVSSAIHPNQNAPRISPGVRTTSTVLRALNALFQLRYLLLQVAQLVACHWRTPILSALAVVGAAPVHDADLE